MVSPFGNGPGVSKKRCDRRGSWRLKLINNVNNSLGDARAF
jgi:hypothetical protein